MAGKATAMRARLVRGVPAIGAAAVIALLIWLLVWLWVPPLAGMGEAADRLIFALKCVCVLLLLTFLTGAEAISHERLASDAFDPLTGHETRPLRINLRYLQNTLEQTVLFVPGLLVLAVYCDSGSAMRAIVAACLVWSFSRIAFWIGYHIGPEHRVAGLVGQAQNMLVLLYVCARFGYEVAGTVGAAVPLVLFGIAELLLISAVRRTTVAQRKGEAASGTQARLP